MKHRPIQKTFVEHDWWDPYSCQPYKMRDEDKPRSGLGNIVEYLKVALTALVSLPVLTIQYLLLRKSSSTKTPQEFIGLSVSLDDEWADEMVDMVSELGVKRLLIRIPSWDADYVEKYVEFMSKFEGANFVVNILQSRDSVRDLQTWQNQVKTIISKTLHLTDAYWIGNAINRTKWGCAHTGDALLLQEKVEELRNEFSDLKILGSSVIDFEPLLTWRTLFNFKRFKLQGNAALMYVNRRHSPYGAQYGIFDLENKLRLTKAMTKLSNRCDDQLWIPETNWPLLDTKPYTPNSGNPTRTCDEDTQAEYLKMFYQIAWHSGWVEHVYWWQLINPGYGLVDHRDGSLRKLPSYYALKSLLDGELKKPAKVIKNPY